jgi:uncharacterized protein (TIGR02217 family)
MAHDDTIILPASYSYGANIGPGILVDVVTNTGGFRKTNLMQTQFTRSYQIGYNVRSPEAATLIMNIYLAIDGPAGSFLITDHLDWNSTDGIMGSLGLVSIADTDQPMRNTVDGTRVGDGATTVFQMIKDYAAGAQVHTRDIEKPRASPAPVFALDGAPASPTVNFANGEATFSSAPGIGVVPTWGSAYYTRVAFVSMRSFQELTTFDLVKTPNVELIEAKNE